MDLTEPIVRFWFDRGLSREVHRRLHDAADAPGAPDDERARTLITAASLALAGWEPASAYRSAGRAVDAARAADADGPLAVALGERAWAGAVSGLSTDEQVDADVEQALQHARGCEDASTRAFVLALAGGARVCGSGGARQHLGQRHRPRPGRRAERLLALGARPADVALARTGGLAAEGNLAAAARAFAHFP